MIKMVKLTNSKIKISLGIIVAFFISYLLYGILFKKDDWVYSYTTPVPLGIYVLIIGAVIVLAWLITSIYLIVNKNHDNVKTRKTFGVCLLVSPFAFALLGFIFLSINSVVRLIGLIAIPVLLIATDILGIRLAFKKNVKIALVPLFIVPVIVLAFGFGGFFLNSSGRMSSSMGGLTPSFSSNGPMKAMAESMNSADSLGFAVGGAMDINNFRENIRSDYFPISTDITYEGLFYDYFFDTGITEECDELFCPSYSYAVSKDPISNEEEYYLQVGLNSGMKESDFQRKKLNLVVVLDISGSMGSSFRRYYYDDPLRNNEEDSSKSKLDVASESIVALLDHLNSDDSFGMVLFDNDAYLAKPLNEIGDTDMNSIKNHILELTPRGGTNFDAGYSMGTDLFKEKFMKDPEEYENRIIFLTDAMPNLGRLDKDSLFGMTQENADNNIYSTFIGIGVDFNTALIDHITKIKGANYYSVHTSEEFKTRMDDEFEYMVTPLVFDLKLELDSDDFKIDKVYGSPEADEATGEIMKVNTLFPSKVENGQTKGGIIIIKLSKIGQGNELKLSTSYEDRSGKINTNEKSVELINVNPDYYGNIGIRKGILLSRYTNLMKTWITDERKSRVQNIPIEPMIDYDTGIIIPEYKTVSMLSQWERQSVPLSVSDEYKAIISDFKDYFKSEMTELGDETLDQEILILEKLENY